MDLMNRKHEIVAIMQTNHSYTKTTILRCTALTNEYE